MTREVRRILLLGGARSGKSVLAETLLAECPEVVYVATGGTDGGSAEWAERVALHRARRPEGWTTVESIDLEALLRQPGPPLLIDCVSLWLTGVLDEVGAWEESTWASGGEAALRRRVAGLLTAWQHTGRMVVAVSNEVGSGVVPATRSGRLFRDELGRLNAALAATAHQVTLVVAGLPIHLAGHPPEPATPPPTGPAPEPPLGPGNAPFHPALTLPARPTPGVSDAPAIEPVPEAPPTPEAPEADDASAAEPLPGTQPAPPTPDVPGAGGTPDAEPGPEAPPAPPTPDVPGADDASDAEPAPGPSLSPTTPPTSGEAWRFAVGTLSVLPVAVRRWDRAAAGAAMALAPAVGLLLGVLAAGVAAGAFALGTGGLLAGTLAAGVLALLTRGLHLDGLADTADALGSNRPAAQALKIMRASDIGPFGVMALLLTTLAQVAAFARLFDTGGWRAGAAGIVLATVTARLALILGCRTGIPSARPDGLGAIVAGTVSRRRALAATAAVLLPAAALGLATTTGPAGALAHPAAATGGLTAALLLLRHCRTRFTGITGDVLGALAETAATTTAVLLLPALTLTGIVG